MGTKSYVSTAKSRIAGAVSAAPTAAELAFFNREETRAWWDPNPNYGQHVNDKGIWTDRKNGFDLVPYGSLLPVYSPTGGPDGQPVVQGRSSGATADALVTPSGNAVVATGDLCVWAVAKAGTNSAAPLFSLAGNNGGGVTVHLRPTDLVLVRTESDGLVYQTRISQTLEDATFHLVQFNYKHGSPGEMSIWANGVLLTGGTPADGKYAYSHGFPSARMAWFGEYDLTDGMSINPARNLPIAMCGVATTHAPDNNAWQASLEAMVAERFPSLGL
ncbi:hypothetical protein [Sinorhizobium meliloti]|uniref:hypothetical protein n=1 Tax=Rhizobium meliloti TaxID=382 RepID=UPI000B4A53DB|nr:hypothetical protein [Sinorhizobium meliloti]ASP64371.1 hypothetical protein CDO29_07090 [Sinorhizobium meliloti]MQX02813.1 hypothetical protein [Sinorhizobium meliloti]RVK52071.1 hypothetical protein CN160_09145 [Sinorhizobium meliloti]